MTIEQNWRGLNRWFALWSYNGITMMVLHNGGLVSALQFTSLSFFLFGEIGARVFDAHNIEDLSASEDYG